MDSGVLISTSSGPEQLRALRVRLRPVDSGAADSTDSAVPALAVLSRYLPDFYHWLQLGEVTAADWGELAADLDEAAGSATHGPTKGTTGRTVRHEQPVGDGPGGHPGRLPDPRRGRRGQWRVLHHARRPHRCVGHPGGVVFEPAALRRSAELANELLAAERPGPAGEDPESTPWTTLVILVPTAAGRLDPR